MVGRSAASQMIYVRLVGGCENTWNQVENPNTNYLRDHLGHPNSPLECCPLIYWGPVLALTLQTPWPATEPRNPETPKVHLKVRKMPFWTPRKNAPKSQLKCPKSLFLDIFTSQKQAFWDILIDFWGHFSRGSKMAFFGLLNGTL